jgi:hypothetical protein
MSGRVFRMATTAAVAALAGVTCASAQSLPAKSLSTSRTPSAASTAPPPQTLGALAWIERTHTRLGSFDLSQSPSASSGASRAPSRAASIASASTTRRGGRDTALGEPGSDVSTALKAADPQLIAAPTAIQRLPSLLPASPISGAGTYANSQSATLRINATRGLLPTRSVAAGPCLGVIGSSQCAQR